MLYGIYHPTLKLEEKVPAILIKHCTQSSHNINTASFILCRLLSIRDAEFAGGMRTLAAIALGLVTCVARFSGLDGCSELESREAGCSVNALGLLACSFSHYCSFFACVCMFSLPLSYDLFIFFTHPSNIPSTEKKKVYKKQQKHCIVIRGSILFTYLSLVLILWLIYPQYFPWYQIQASLLKTQKLFKI